MGVCLHPVFVPLFNGFQGCLNLDPLAPAQSKRVFSFSRSPPRNHEKIAFREHFGDISVAFSMFCVVLL